MSSTNSEKSLTDLLYGVTEIAGYLNVRPRQAHYMIDKGGLPVFRIGGKICGRRSTITAWMTERERAGAPVATKE